MRKILLFTLFSLLSLSSAIAQTKSQADSAYIKEDYATAIELYETILQNGEAAEVYYNLGNSYYKNDNIARAILNYERALLLDPGNGDIRANLEIARAKTVDKVAVIPELFFVEWIKSLSHLMRVDQWGTIGVVCFVLFLIGMALYFFNANISVKKTGFFSAVVLILLCVVSNLFASQLRSELTQHNKAIVLQPTVTVRSTPSETGTGLFVLHEGHKVEIKDNTMTHWKEVKLADGKVGWIPTEAIEMI